MKIGIDIRCLAEGNRTGVEEYTISFLKRLFEQDSKNEYLLFINSFKKVKEDLSWLEEYPNVEMRNFGFPNKLLNFAMWFLRWPKIDLLLGGVDLFFAPNISFIALSDKCKFTLTVHDLSFERFPEHFSAKRRLWHYVVNPRLLCKRADKILAVSNSTKDDLTMLYRISESKIEVAYPRLETKNFTEPNISGDKTMRMIRDYSLPDEFVLYLGTIEPRKNIISLVKAFEHLKKSGKVYKNLKLVIAGRVGWSYERIIKAVESSPNKKDILFTGFVHDSDKAILYKLAKVFVYPSFFEGFGFPPVEAMASGVPVITSNCSSIPEVVQDAAVLIDPYRPAEISLAIKLLLEDKILYNDFIKKGRMHVEKIEKRYLEENILSYLKI
ncbi:glycosyltransferase family 4 protein [bacterium]|jgi:glycosyltransferase involved in cell wall biosynthesis|nr:glycosyltransferase family 4 protein [bacterium]MBT4251099.1 glycosyltransferase family 4 protein [bacterium]MBT4598109.1 glycosyltransferase family 4 protein [bacterium]MBT6753451.1 glycosyltransferase family 4 protein [bacterium]MBT7038164.1 glycosyltransferase family 4 protein [bacterium]